MSLEAFAPVPRKETIAGVEISIEPLRMRQIPAFTRALSGLMPAALSGNYIRMASEHYEGAREALVVAIGVEPEWLDDLLPDDFLRLLGAVMEVNIDFFARRVLPETQRVTASLMTAMKGANGATSSPGSSEGDTGSTN